MKSGLFLDTATGHHMHKPSYLQTTGDLYPFDLLTIQLWLNRFAQCPLTLQPVNTQPIIPEQDTQANPSPLMGLYEQIYGYNFDNYQDFCEHVSNEYTKKKSNLRTSEAAGSEIPALLLTILLVYAALQIELFTKFYAILFLLMLTYITVRRIFIWLMPAYFATDADRKPPEGWITQECKALVFIWQSERQPGTCADLTHLDPKVRSTLETMRRMLADVYLSIFHGKYLGISSIADIPWPLQKEIWPGIKEALNYLKKLGAPSLVLPTQSHAVPSHMLPNATAEKNLHSHPQMNAEAPEDRPHLIL